MSLIKISTVTEGSTGATMLTPDQVVEQLRTLRGQIPEFVQLQAEEANRIRRLGTLNVDFARAGIGAVDASDIVQRAIGNTPDELYGAEDELSRWSNVENELRSLLRGMITANLVRRARLNAAALQAYGISKQLARQEDHADLLPYVERMKRLRKARRRKAEPPDATTAPVPAAPAKQP